MHDAYGRLSRTGGRLRDACKAHTSGRDHDMMRIIDLDDVRGALRAMGIDADTPQGRQAMRACARMLAGRDGSHA